MSTNKASRKIKIIYENINDIERVKRGDNVRFCRCGSLYYHHVIALEDGKSDGDKNLKVIHYTGDKEISTNDKAMGKVIKSFLKCDPSKQDISRVKYGYISDNGEIEEIKPDPDEVIKRAKERLGERKYSPKYNNCEHFAAWCVIGFSWCQQLEDSGKNFLASIGEECRPVRVARTAGKQTLRAGAKTVIFGPAKDTTRLFVKEGSKTASKKCAAILGGGVTFVVEGGVLVYDLHKIWGTENNKDKYQKRVETWEVSGRATLASAGGIGGAVLGSLIPIPILGVVCGSVIGSAIGSFAGSFSGGTIGRLVHKKPITA